MISLSSLGRLAVLSAVGFVSLAHAQSLGTVSGSVVLDGDGEPMHGARITLSPLGRTADSTPEGKYEFLNVPPGTYDIVALATGLSAEHQTIQLTAGATQTVDFRLKVAAVRETITVTATGREESTLGMVQSVASMDQLQLNEKSATSLGEVLQGELGVNKRSSGPGSSRPVIRGFDGDRVLILEDGIRSGSLSYQSGDHGEPIDVNKLERVEVVRGPATLLYGSNAIGGVVNAISRHDVFHQHTHEGVRGFVTGLGGTNSGLGGATGGFEFGRKAWEFWGSGGGQRTGEYHTPLGAVVNSQSRAEQADAGLGRYGEKGFFSFNYGFTDSNYGIPVDPDDEAAEVAVLAMRRNNVRLTGGLKNIGFLEDIQARANYTDYNHKELVDGDVETSFFNKQFIYRTVFNQKKIGRLNGSFGFWGMHRNYETVGAEAITPPTTQNSMAAFAVESLDWETTRIQFGGRLESNRYNPTGLEKRRFTGFSGSAGVSQRLWGNGVFVANYSRSYRAPALEELYNNGPHPGNATFEIGNPELVREQNDGIDFSVRHHSARLRAEANYFYYRINDFVYLAPTGEIEDGLPVADYFQQNARYMGAEAKVDASLHPNLWLNVSVDSVNAQLTKGNVPLPRIPPVRGRIGLDARFKNFSVRPELNLANAQTRTFTNESSTAGYATVNLTGSYTLASAHNLHVISVGVFNANDRLYRNHLSFIKNFAPEIGRGVRVTYTWQFF